MHNAVRPRYKPFTKSAIRNIVCPACHEQWTDTILINMKDYNKIMYDPFVRSQLLNVEKKCQACIAEEKIK